MKKRVLKYAGYEVVSGIAKNVKSADRLWMTTALRVDRYTKGWSVGPPYTDR
jgi:hypothetical protein